MRFNKQWLFVVFIVGFLFCVNALVAATLLVPSKYATIQEAIDAAADEDVVLIDDGTYTGKGNKSLTWDGTVKHITVKSKKGPEKCIIDCEYDGNAFIFDDTGQDTTDVIDGFTITNGSAEYGAGIYCYKSSPTITNCIITGNDAEDGGGIYCNYSSPTITGCILKNNEADDDGGGISCVNNSSPIITNCTIGGEDEEDENHAEYDGGGIYCYESSPTITSCLIANNEANDDAGGGIYCYESSPTITGCYIEYNSAWGGEIDDHGYGGGIYCYESSPTITNCIIKGNYTDDEDGGYGGGIYCESSSPVITKCTIVENSSEDGGGISCNDSSPVITNCTIVENSSDYSGGGIYCDASSLTITNCTIAFNNTDIKFTSPATEGDGISGHSASKGSDEGVGILAFDYSYLIIKNSILWGNSSFISFKAEGPQSQSDIGGDYQIYLYDSDLDITYSDIEDMEEGIEDGIYEDGNCNINAYNNIAEDPLFINASGITEDKPEMKPIFSKKKKEKEKENAGYHLSKNSPCRDSGTNDGAPEDDIDGQKRPFNRTVDMGSDEYSTSSPVDTKNGDVTLSLDDGALVETDSYDEEDLPDTGKPEVPFPFGLFSLRIVDIEAGGTVSVTLTCPENVPTDAQYWKYGSTSDEPTDHWYQFPFGSNDGDNIITLTLTDGGYGDDNYEVADSEIWDPGGIGMIVEKPVTGQDDEDDNPCFMETVLGTAKASTEIMLVRRFRDENLSTNPVGRVLVSTYYRASPALADFIRGYPILKNTVRGMLRPLIWMSAIS